MGIHRAGLAVVGLALWFLALGACGQKGPLYLPDESGAPATEQDRNQPDKERDAGQA